MKIKIVRVMIVMCVACALVGCTDPVCEKPTDEPSINYKDSGFVGTWVYETDKRKNTYDLRDNGLGLWSQVLLPPIDPDVPSEATGALDIVWLPLADGKVELTGTLIENPSMVYHSQGTLSADKTELTVGSLVYTKQP